MDFGEHRFTNGGRRAPQPFSYRVVFDPKGDVIASGFWPNGMFLERLMPHVRRKKETLLAPEETAP